MPEISAERRRAHPPLFFRLAAKTATQGFRRLISRTPSGPHARFDSEADAPPPWKLATETLVFRFGPWTLAERNFQSLSNMTNPLTAEGGALKLPPIFQPTTYQQMRDDGTISRTLGFDSNAIRYVSHRGKRYFIDLLPGPFDDYFAKFSAKTRNTLKRKIRHFAERSGGTVNFRIYSSPEEIIEFRRQALTVSLVSYQRKIGFGLPETDEFRANLIEQAANGRVFGFVLMEKNRPISYVYCRTDQDIVIYSYCGYDPEFAQLSPGTVLLFLISDGCLSNNDLRCLTWAMMVGITKPCLPPAQSNI